MPIFPILRLREIATTIAIRIVGRVITLEKAKKSKDLIPKRKQKDLKIKTINLTRRNIEH